MTVETLAGHDFKRRLSLDLLIEFWRNEARSDGPLANQATALMMQVENLPELHGAIEDREIFRRHRKLLDSMLAAVFPPALQALSCGAAAVPATFDIFHSTPRFQRELLRSGFLRGTILIEGLDWRYLRTLFSYLGILRRCYGLHFPFEKSVLVELEDDDSGLFRYYQLRGQFDTAVIRPVGSLPPLPDDAATRLSASLTDLNALRDIIHPELFEFYGFMVYEATEVTEEMSLSALKQDLIAPDALTARNRFLGLQRRLRNLLKLPELELSIYGLEGFLAFRIDGEQGFRHDQVGQALNELLAQACRERLYQGKEYVVEDTSLPNQCLGFVEREREPGSLILAPLMLEGELVGILSLSTPRSHALTGLAYLQIQGALPLFALAVRRTAEGFANQVQAVMKERFTAIHPSVEWRFCQAARSFVRSGVDQEIVFEDVYSLFASSDIRSSTDIRNKSICQDLMAQLELARKVIQTALREKSLSFLESRDYRLQRLYEGLENGLDSGEEARVLEFVEQEVEGLFPVVSEFGPSVRDAIEAYHRAIDPNRGYLFARRHNFEQALNQLTEAVAEVLRSEQVEAQAIFPHYFQMFRTDGVDHTIYVGQSMAGEADFDELYLRNLKLWQLLTTCKVARVSESLQGKLDADLNTAHLILAQRSPVTLRYSLEEKKFSVDGAYNARYEMVKKRIDKARIKDGGARLTQPGQLAVVYSHPAEGQEYHEFFDYMLARNEVQGEIEDLQLEEVQGVTGLRALRVAIRL